MKIVEISHFKQAETQIFLGKKVTELFKQGGDEGLNVFVYI